MEEHKSPKSGKEAQDTKRHTIVQEGSEPLQEAAQHITTPVQPPTQPAFLASTGASAILSQQIRTHLSPVFRPLESKSRQPGNFSTRSKVNRHEYTATATQSRTASPQDAKLQKPISDKRKPVQKKVTQAGTTSTRETGRWPEKHSLTAGIVTKGTRGSDQVTGDLKTKRRSASEQKCSAQKALTSRRSSMQTSNNTRFTTVKFEREEKVTVPALKWSHKISSSTSKPHGYPIGEKPNEKGQGDRAERENATKKAFISSETKPKGVESKGTPKGVESKGTPKGVESKIPSIFSPKDKSFRKKSVKKTNKNIFRNTRIPTDETPTEQSVKQPSQLNIIHPDILLDQILCGPPASTCSDQMGGSSELTYPEEPESQLALVSCLVAFVALTIKLIVTEGTCRQKGKNS